MDNPGKEKYEVLRENERDANRVLTIVLFVSMGILVALWVLIEMNVLLVEDKIHRLLMAVSMGIMLIASIVSIYFKFDRPWIKYVLMSVLILTYAMQDAVFTYSTAILIVIPPVISSRYFSRKYTLVVVVATYFAFLLSAVWGANNGMIDLNNLQLAPGTVINMGEEIWISHVVSDLDYDRNLMIRNAVFYSYGTKLALSLIGAIASILVATQGRRMVVRQQKLTEEATSVTSELTIAAKIQEAMLPGVSEAFPDRKEFDLYAFMTPAFRVGGDFYDFFLVDDDHLALVMGDVSDKGIPAALFMVHCRNTISGNVMMGKSPSRALIDANNKLCENNSESMFVTVWLGILTISTGLLTVCNAGHERPVLLQNDGAFKEFRDTHGFAMGCIPDAQYPEYEIQLEPGDKLFLYTDGVTEAANADNKLFGIKRTLDALNKDINASPEKMIKEVCVAMKSFMKDTDQVDDITMLSFAYKG
jgi:serine phosphatase RsbU (regulator of sigma subunit)